MEYTVLQHSDSSIFEKFCEEAYANGFRNPQFSTCYDSKYNQIVFTALSEFSMVTTPQAPAIEI